MSDDQVWMSGKSVEMTSCDDIVRGTKTLPIIEFPKLSPVAPNLRTSELHPLRPKLLRLIDRHAVSHSATEAVDVGDIQTGSGGSSADVFPYWGAMMPGFGRAISPSAAPTKTTTRIFE